MPRLPLHSLIWSNERTLYELFTQEHLDQQFHLGDDTEWFTWLDAHPSFAFHGVAGSLNVYKEARPRGGAYWYAYHTTERRTRKRYLGRTASVTFARLEEVAIDLSNEPAPASPALDPPQHERDTVSCLALPVTPYELFPGIALLSTRFSPPLLPPRLLAREHLLTRLDAALSHRLTLLSASAGWGKTTLLSAWAARSPLPTAWLSLDEQDNDPARFWVSVLVALRHSDPRLSKVGEVALAMLRSPQPAPLTTVLITLLNELSTLSGPTILLLDDYHLIEEQIIHDSLLFVLEHLPTTLHLVLASRVDPPLALSRLRVLGQLLELRDADLRFQEEEAACFLTHTMDLSLSQEEATQLARRTEGWIAGLQLAALALQQREDLSAFGQGFTGGQRHVQDYVQEEILARLPTRLQNLLLQSAILTRLSASLCQVVTGEAESPALLEQAERANLFLVPLDEERRWYRMHDLFREALLARLQATQSERVAFLHQRAASWYEEQGELREAIAHALQASDFFSAARLMGQVAEEVWFSGESHTLYQWVMALPAEAVRRHVRFALTAALYVLIAAASMEAAQFVRVRSQVEQMMERVERATVRRDEAQGSHENQVFCASERALIEKRTLVA